MSRSSAMRLRAVVNLSPSRRPKQEASILKFSDIKPSILVDRFPLNSGSVEAFRKLKAEIGSALLQVSDEYVPLVFETDASDTAIVAALNQVVRQVAFF